MKLKIHNHKKLYSERVSGCVRHWDISSSESIKNGLDIYLAKMYMIYTDKFVISVFISKELNLSFKIRIINNANKNS